MSPQATEYQRLTIAFDEDPGYKYLMRMKLHEQSLRIFGGNFSDLMRDLDFFENPDNIGDIWNEETPNKWGFLLDEIMRHFHNFLSASQSLVDHTRTLMQKFHAGQQIHKLYDFQIKERFAQDPLTLFVKDLRNYFLHKGIPTASMEVTFDPQTKKPPISLFLLDTIELKKWSK